VRAVHAVLAPGAPVEIRVPDVAKRLSLVTPDSTLEQLQGIMGFSGGQIGSIYTRKHLLDIGKQVGFDSVAVEEDGDELVMTGRKKNAS